MKQIIENSKDGLIDILEDLKRIYYNQDITEQKRSLQIRSHLVKCSDSKWTIFEETLLEIEVDMRTQVLANQLDKLPPVTKRIEKLAEVLNENFSDQPELAKILVDSIPHDRIVRNWTKRPEWKEEVDKRMRDDTLFSVENRHQMIQAIFREGLGGSAKHAEMYLKMSGDLGKAAEKDPIESTFEKVQKRLHKGK